MEDKLKRWTLIIDLKYLFKYHLSSLDLLIYSIKYLSMLIIKFNQYFKNKFSKSKHFIYWNIYKYESIQCWSSKFWPKKCIAYKVLIFLVVNLMNLKTISLSSHTLTSILVVFQ